MLAEKNINYTNWQIIHGLKNYKVNIVGVGYLVGARGKRLKTLDSVSKSSSIQ